MSLSINNNITSLNAWRNLKQTDGSISRTMEKLSSGLRINRAADDPAGLVISEKMRAQLAGIETAVKNSEKAVNMIQTAEAALDKVGKLLVKVRQLAIDSANSGVNDASMLAANQSELDEAVASITRIADYTTFGTKKLLDGNLGGSVTKSVNTLATNSTFDLATATTSGQDGAAVSLTLTQKATLGTTTITIKSGATSILTLDGINLTVASGASKSVMAANAKNAVNNDATLKLRYTATTGAAGSGKIILTNKRYGTVQGSASVTGTAISAAGSISAVSAKNIAATMLVGTTSYTLNKGTGLTLADANGNQITVTSTGNNAVTTGASQGVGTITDQSATFQIGANELQTVSVSIQSTKAISLGKSATYGDAETTVATFFNLQDLTSLGGKVAAGGGVLKNGNADEIAQSVGVIDKAIDDVANIRGSLGAVQADNLQVQLDSLRVSYENLQASESTIRDADMTSEMATFTKYQVMMQAGTAMLAQANQMPNNILQLLK